MAEHPADCGGDYDKRVLMRKLLNGEISEESMEKYLQDLPDVSSRAEEMVVE